MELKEKEEARRQRKKEEKAEYLAALRRQWEIYVGSSPGRQTARRLPPNGMT